MLAFFTMRGTESPELSPQEAQTDNAALVVSKDNTAIKAVGAADNVVAAKDAAQTSTAAKIAPASAAVPPMPLPVGRSMGPLTGPFELFLEANEHTWLTYSFDGGDLIEVTLQMNDRISIQAEKTITVRLGNAGGVAGTLNGQKLPPFGETGRVRTITFGR